MIISEYLDLSRVRLDVQVRSKKHALQILSEIIAESDDLLSSQRVFDAMFHRERLGCTGLGHGVALPHARFAGVTKCISAFVRTSQEVAFDSDDGQSVRLIFAMILPATSGDENMYNLSHIATLFMDPGLRQILHNASDEREAYKAILAAAMPAPGDLNACN